LSDLQNQQIKNYNDFIPKDIEVKIKPPERKIQKRNLFSFLDEDNINGE